MGQGTLLADCGVLLQLVWTPDWPDFVSTMGGLSFCSLVETGRYLSELTATAVVLNVVEARLHLLRFCFNLLQRELGCTRKIAHGLVIPNKNTEVIGSFAPLSAFPVEYVGKVSACIQVCMSLGEEQ